MGRRLERRFRDLRGDWKVIKDRVRMRVSCFPSIVLLFSALYFVSIEEYHHFLEDVSSSRGRGRDG